jgi:branched-chain amino acid transport system substrate-binding protein
MKALEAVLLAGAIVASSASSADAEVRIGLAAPLTGPYAWGGAWTRGNVEEAVADLNAGGGVLGEPIEVIVADDYCDGEQAVAAAKKLVADRVVAVFSHQCSGAAIPASEVYAAAGIPMISTGATNPKLTEQGHSNVFRVVGRDDVQARMAAELLARRWGDRRIAVLHDGQAYGQSLAEQTRKQLNARGVR